MSTPSILVNEGGSLEKKLTSVAEVSFWYIPGGCDYSNAQAIVGYFDDLAFAKEFQRKNEMPPEMAFLTKY